MGFELEQANPEKIPEGLTAAASSYKGEFCCSYSRRLRSGLVLTNPLVVDALEGIDPVTGILANVTRG